MPAVSLGKTETSFFDRETPILQIFPGKRVFAARSVRARRVTRRRRLAPTGRVN